MIRIGIAGNFNEANPYLQELLHQNQIEFTGILAANDASWALPYPVLDEDHWLQQCDALVFTSLTPALHDTLEHALKEGRHVLLTQPGSLLREKTYPILKMARESNVICMAGNEHFYHPVLRSILPEIHLPLFIETHHLTTFQEENQTLDVVFSLMLQDIQTVLRIVKSEIKHISASGVKVLSDTIDIANARLEFTNGTLANLTCSRIAQKQLHLSRIFQKDCYHVLDYHQHRAERIFLTPKTEEHAGSLQTEIKPVEDASPYRLIIDDFIQSIAEQNNSGLSLDQSYKAQELCEIILKKINFLGDD